MVQDKKVAIGRLLSLSKARRRVLANDQFLNAPIQVGMTLNIEFKFSDNSGVKTQSQLVGFLRGEYLIVTTPKINGEYVNYSRHRNLVVRYILEGSVYGFQVGILRVMGSPFNLTFLEYPETIEQVSLRGAPRVQVVIPFEREGDGDSENETLLNISATGALLQLSKPARIDDTFNISFVLPNGQALTNIGCTVRRVDMTSQRILTGIQFDKKHPHYPLVESYVGVVLETLGKTEETQ